MGKTSSDSKNRYNAKAYDRLSIVVPKGVKDLLKQAAVMEGQSVNALVQSALLDKLKLESWPDDKPF